MLRYLFTAIYKDGTEFQQTQEDKALTRDNGSAFSDIKQDELLAFILTEDGVETPNTYGVNLEDGRFEINSIPFFAYDKPLENRRLIFFRRHLHGMNVNFVELEHNIEYHLGWQGNDPVTKENIQRTIIIN